MLSCAQHTLLPSSNDRASKARCTDRHPEAFKCDAVPGEEHPYNDLAQLYPETTVYTMYTLRLKGTLPAHEGNAVNNLPISLSEDYSLKNMLLLI